MTASSTIAAPLATNATGWRWTSVALWAAASAIAVFFSLILLDSTIVNGEYLPRGNDSFYHARRILDEALGVREFYQFDERLHSPDGAWIPWPWGYDYILAQVTRFALLLFPRLDPAAFITHAPVAWILVNAALFLAAARAAGLAIEMQLLAMLCFAISPLTQLLHAVGMVDHHYVEHTFVLATIWLGLRWFQEPEVPRRAAALGVVLGLAPAFHTGLFILQLLPLTTIAILWVRGSLPPPRSILPFVIALPFATALVLVASQPFREGLFEFGLLSWFHLYVAVATAVTLWVLANWRFSTRVLFAILAFAAAVTLPLLPQLLGGAEFVSGTFSILDQIMETQSPYQFWVTSGARVVASYYSWTLVLAPALLAYFTYRLLRERSAAAIYYAAVAVFGLALLLAQFRLEYFGFFALVTSVLLLIDRLRERYGWRRGIVFVATLCALVLVYQPALRERLFLLYPPSGNIDYANAMRFFADLEQLCKDDPGVVLANPEDGNPVLYHTDCDVIANVFILRPADAQHIAEIDRLWALPATQLRVERPDVRYVLLRAPRTGDGTTLPHSDTVAHMLARGENLPEGFRLIRSLYLEVNADGPRGIYGRLYKVDSTTP